MKTTLKVSLTDDLYYFIHDRLDDGAFTSASEYIRALVRDDRDRSPGNGRTRQRTKPSGPRKVNDIMRDEY